MKTAVVIPVYNEGERAFASIHAAQGFARTDEVVVIDDGSLPATQDVLSKIDGITLLTHAQNKGKGEALDTGVTHVLSEGFDRAVFLDGDLINVKASHIKELLDPLDDKALMSIGYLGLRKAYARSIYKKWGALSGQRALSLEVWDLLSQRDKHGFNIEAALNARMRKNSQHGRISRVALEGVSHVGKREKEANLFGAGKSYARTYGSALMTYTRIELETLFN